MPISQDVERPSEGLSGRAWWLGCALVLIGALAATVPTAGDIGLTWDEPSYRTSQLVSAQWWAAWPKVRSRADLDALLSPDALLYYWPYGRFGYNFHPPLAGQLSLLTHALFGPWMKDIPSRRMASVIEYSLTIALAFGFLARRYGAWVGGVAAGALLVMPRVYGDGHIAGTDTPGLLLWVVTALAFWKGLYEPNARKWRVLVGVALGLGFVEKMAAIVVLGPILLWLVATRLPRTFRRGGRADWIDGVVTSTALLLPLGVALREVIRLARLFPKNPGDVDLFRMHPPTSLPGAILLLPLLIWIGREAARKAFPRHPVWGAERPALETWTAVLAFAPVIGWLGNPAWWRETLPRLAHYYQISADRELALPPIRIIYLGEVYTFSLPWHNAWVLIAVTVPVGILLASVVGLVWSLGRSWKLRDALPWYFALHLTFLPILRMLPTPAHDGVRLFLPTFFFLAAFAGWGMVAIGDGLANLSRRVGLALPFSQEGRQGKPYPTGNRLACRGLVAALVIGPAAWQLALIHPFELSYYNELIGGPRGAWRRGFELSYWYEAFDGRALADLNRELPRGAAVDFLEPDLISTPSLACLQELGALRGDVVLGAPDAEKFPYGWMLTHDSKATPRTRLMFVMTPFYAFRPAQLDGLRVVTVVPPDAVARAWALDTLTRGVGEVEAVLAPAWVRDSPWFRPLARFWGEGLTNGPPLAVDGRIFAWARTDPEGLRTAARTIAARAPIEPNSGAARLRAYLDRRVGDLPEDRLDWRTMYVLRNRPEALPEAVEILIKHRDAVRSVLLRGGYTDEGSIGGFLDRDLVTGKAR
jgi:4-amino-4-deoxy-L-arabinose transferase-like glycosyltransferase